MRMIRRMVFVLTFFRLTLGFTIFQVSPPGISNNKLVRSRICVADTNDLSGDNNARNLLIHWKGEDVEGYSMQFRRLEFQGAMSATLGVSMDEASETLHFDNALNYTGSDFLMPEGKVEAYNTAMQYVGVKNEKVEITKQAFIQTVERSCLVHALYEVVAESSGYEDLAEIALRNGGFDDLRVGHENEAATWCLRVRHYGQITDENRNVIPGSSRERRHNDRTRSMTLEKVALQTLTPLLLTFGGSVNLKNPDCKIYVFDGLEDGKKVLARRIARGPRASIISPNSRICVTNTPLSPMAAFVMCNVAGIREQHTILDPYAGSCSILLAAAMINPTCRTVGIEIAHDGIVNRDNIRKDFTTRGLVEPVALLQGDSTESTVRAKAKEVIGNEPFDLIISDPPYGIRESANYNEMAPINELISAISEDFRADQPLLRKGGRLVCFIPCHEDEQIDELIPTSEQLRKAGLRFETKCEQPLNDKLSRWLVSFVNIQNNTR